MRLQETVILKATVCGNFLWKNYLRYTFHPQFCSKGFWKCLVFVWLEDNEAKKFPLFFLLFFNTSLTDFKDFKVEQDFSKTYFKQSQTSMMELNTPLLFPNFCFWKVNSKTEVLGTYSGTYSHRFFINIFFRVEILIQNFMAFPSYQRHVMGIWSVI